MPPQKHPKDKDTDNWVNEDLGDGMVTPVEQSEESADGDYDTG